MDEVKFSALVSTLQDLVVFHSGGDDRPFLGGDEVETDVSSADGGTGEGVVGMPPFKKLPWKKSKGVGLRVKPPAAGSDAGGKAGTVGGGVSLGAPPFRGADEERERSPKNVFFFFTGASER